MLVRKAIMNKILAKCGSKKKLTTAHRLSQRDNSPIVAQFLSKSDAQEIFSRIRSLENNQLSFFGLGEAGKVEVRYHLSTFLSELSKTATIIRKEANWAFARAITSNQTVELVKAKGRESQKVVLHSIQDALEFRNDLMAEGTLNSNSPAAKLTLESNRTTRKRAPPARKENAAKRR